jgi:hypothetical protein
MRVVLRTRPGLEARRGKLAKPEPLSDDDLAALTSHIRDR